MQRALVAPRYATSELSEMRSCVALTERGLRH